MGAIDDCRLKTNQVVVVGMIPRRGATGVACRKSVGINDRLGDLSIPGGVLFVDPYSVFYG